MRCIFRSFCDIFFSCYVQTRNVYTSLGTESTISVYSNDFEISKTSLFLRVKPGLIALYVNRTNYSLNIEPYTTIHTSIQPPSYSSSQPQNYPQAHPSANSPPAQAASKNVYREQLL